MWVPAEADAKARTQVQKVYLGGNPRKHQKGVGKWAQEGKEAIKSVYLGELPLWASGA